MNVLAHVPCHKSDVLTSVGIGTLLGMVVFRPWRSTAKSSAKAARLSLWTFPVVIAVVLTAGACGGAGGSAPRPTTAARLEIVSPAPSAIVPPNFKLQMNLTGAKVVPATQTGTPLRGDEGHIHVSLDGKLISMTYGTEQDMNNIAPGPHNIQAEFVATDHAPFANRVIVAVAFSVAAPAA